jgi:hypothetical protein
LSRGNLEKSAIIIPTWDRTGSTFLANAVMGFISPDNPVIADDDMDVITGDAMVTPNIAIVKTHNMNVTGWVSKSEENNFDFYGITINRPETSKMLPSYYHHHNILQLTYSDILETDIYTVPDIIDFLHSKLVMFLPKHITLSKEDAVRRINNMNVKVEELKDLPFKIYDPFYHIHGSHRRR